jgi:hypothetical protein
LVRLKVPFPDPVDAVTVHVAVGPGPVTAVIAGVPPRPPFVKLKSLAVTPFTGSLNVTVHDTLEAFVGLEPARAIDVTVGAVVSSVNVIALPEKALPARSVAVACTT